MGWELTSGSPEGPRVVGLGDGLLSTPGKEEMALVEEAISAAHRGVFFFFFFMLFLLFWKDILVQILSERDKMRKSLNVFFFSHGR